VQEVASSLAVCGWMGNDGHEATCEEGCGLRMDGLVKIWNDRNASNFPLQAMCCKIGVGGVAQSQKQRRLRWGIQAYPGKIRNRPFHRILQDLGEITCRTKTSKPQGQAKKRKCRKKNDRADK